VDVRGWNFAVEGVIAHQCAPPIPVTLDLAFVITGREKVPSLTQWGLIILLVVLAGIATWVVFKRRRVVTA